MVPTLLRGFKDAKGSWKTICIFVLNGRISFLDKEVNSLPLSNTSPLLLSNNLITQRANVDLPDPLSPTIPSVSPR